MSFIDTYPMPDQESATARDVAGWYAAHALWLIGRADRMEEEHGRGWPEALHLVALAGAKADTARVLFDYGDGMVADWAARELIRSADTGEAVQQAAYTIAMHGGYDHDTARSDGYQS